MPRSLKKSPFVAYHLLKKINTLNKAGKIVDDRDQVTIVSFLPALFDSLIFFNK